jgi:DNA-binding NarL/FixJ family response regulator
MPRKPARILVADDHPLFRRGLRELLSAEDDLEVVAEAGDGAEAVSIALRGAIDLAIVDMAMPRMTGLQVAAELARRRPDVRVLIVSAHEGEHNLLDARRAGAAGYLLKTGAESQLAAACRAVMRGESVYPDGPPDKAGPKALTTRETEILKLVAAGWSSQRIADELVISINTVDRHRQNLLGKLGLHDRVDLTRYAIRRGLVEP